MDPGRQIVTDGGPIQESIGVDAKNLADDPIFGVGGDLAFNWAYGNNGVRIILTGGHLSGSDLNDNNSHGLGNNHICNPLNNTVDTAGGCPYDASYIQDCDLNSIDNKCSTPRVMGTDYRKGCTTDLEYQPGPVYGNYAIYVSMEADRFPQPGYSLSHKVEGEIKEMENSLRQLEEKIETAEETFERGQVQLQENIDSVEEKSESGDNQLKESIKSIDEKVETGHQQLEEELKMMKEEFDDCDCCHEGTWHLGMNINPDDGHIFGYTHGRNSKRNQITSLYAEPLLKITIKTNLYGILI